MKETCSFAKEMGKRVAQRRKELGLTQEKAAERCGLSQQFFASIETGGKNVRGESLLELDQLLQRLRQLPGEEYRHMLTVIKEYLWALGRR